ncbi:hypothetical protein RRG08_009549 [Elysia crispata]|uniref:Uncharacterized protein n=1 Tax=Elysia crispata TaxID=231223 RepID=A0AAE1DG90_9GAST|nr:hypothetical protein RRG08_009549 [Elysia crispata]
MIPEIKEILQHSKRDGQMVKSLTASLVSRKEEERHQRNLNENEQLKKQIAEWTCSRPCHVSHLHRLRLHATHLRFSQCYASNASCNRFGDGDDLLGSVCLEMKFGSND